MKKLLGNGMTVVALLLTLVGVVSCGVNKATNNKKEVVDASLIEGSYYMSRNGGGKTYAEDDIDVGYKKMEVIKLPNNQIKYDSKSCWSMEWKDNRDWIDYVYFLNYTDKILLNHEYTVEEKEENNEDSGYSGYRYTIKITGIETFECKQYQWTKENKRDIKLEKTEYYQKKRNQ